MYTIPTLPCNILKFYKFISYDRSSYSDDVLMYIQRRPLFEILSIHAFLYSLFLSIGSQEFLQSLSLALRMSNVKSQMSIRLNLFSERTSGVSLVIFSSAGSEIFYMDCCKCRWCWKISLCEEYDVNAFS